MDGMSLSRTNPSLNRTPSEQYFDFQGLTPHQQATLRITALVVSSISVLSAIVASCLFIRMRRSFRHDLIMLLIQSDAFKAIWFMTYPLVAEVQGPVDSRSSYCQVSGFFLSLGIEACDMAVLLIALHTALYIFRGRNGLYDFRYIAYAAWLLIPVLLSSLAFLGHGYVDTGEFCYLPVDPAWPRRSLSWIPRYIIFVTILVTYALVYIYVTDLMSRFGSIAKRRKSSTPMSSTGSRRPTQASVAPPLNFVPRGQGPSMPSSRRDSGARDGGVGHVSLPTGDMVEPQFAQTTAPPTRPGMAQISEQPEQSNMRSFGPESAAPSYAERRGSKAMAPPWTGELHDHDNVDAPIPSSTGDPTMAPRDPPTRTYSFWRRCTLVAMPLKIQPPPIRPKLATLGRRRQRSSSASAIHLPRSAAESTAVLQIREKIRRQLRKLFIYPVAYLAIWLFPFVAHVMSTGNTGVPPYPITALRVVSLCVSGTVDALLFCIKEKPWRHTRKAASVGWHTVSWMGQHPGNRSNANVGRSREEMRVDGKLAKKRRAKELAERSACNGVVDGNVPKEWWDGFLGPTDELYDQEMALYDREEV